MDRLQIDILNSKAGKLLEDWAELELIAIYKPEDDGFITFVKKIRAKAKDNLPTLEEITMEVELVRAERYGKPA